MKNAPKLFDLEREPSGLRLAFGFFRNNPGGSGLGCPPSPPPNQHAARLRQEQRKGS
jgi:hypothetical protein